MRDYQKEMGNWGGLIEIKRIIIFNENGLNNSK